jgi:thymidylate kinase
VLVALSPVIIHFFGPDGSGKSTQADLLLARLTAQNVKVRKYWIRSPHTLAFLLWKLSIKIGFFRTVLGKSGTYVKIPAVNQNRVLKQLWPLIELVSVAPLVVRAQLYLLSGYNLIAERYVLDTVAFVAFSVDDSSFTQKIAAKLFLKLIPKNAQFIFIDADYNTICARRAGCLVYGGSIIKTELEPQKFIEFQRGIYKTLAQTTNALVVNTAKHSKEETFALITRYLSNTFGNKN